MEAFEIEEILARMDAGGMAWLPFLERDSMLAGIYVVREDDRETHRPHEMDELYYVVSGRGSITVDGETRAASPGSLLFVATGQQHHFHDIEEPLSLLVFFAPVPT